eukprot:UN11060
MDNNSNVYSWGLNMYGQLGCGNIKKKGIWDGTPQCIEMFKDKMIIDIKLSANHSAVLAYNNCKIFMCGNNIHRQCCCDDKKQNILEPT